MTRLARSHSCFLSAYAVAAMSLLRRSMGPSVRQRDQGYLLGGRIFAPANA